MLQWPAKDPDEVLDYYFDWAAVLASGETVVSSVVALVTAAGLVLNSQSNTTTRSTLWVSGGTDGLTGVFTATVQTSGGRTFEAAAVLPIVATVPSGVAITGYNPPTPAYLVMMYPAFAAVPSSTIAAYITQANRAVDTTWTEGDYTFAIMLYACHLMVQAGLGTGAEAQAAASGLLGYKRVKSGQLDLERAGKADSGASKVPDEYAGTTYGQQYWYLLLKNRRGPRVAVSELASGGWYPTIPPYWPYN